MDKDEFVKIINRLGYEVEEPLNLFMMGAETGYDFCLRPTEQERFNWKKCNTHFLKQIIKVANIPLNKMDFTSIKKLCNDEPFIRVVATGLEKVVIAMSLVNKKLPYHL